MKAGADNESGKPVTYEGSGSSIGPCLRAAREKRKLKIEQVAKQLHLDSKIISAIENDDTTALPAPIFVQGYLRSYARLVDLPEEDLVRQYSARASELPPLTVSMKTEKLPFFRLPSAKQIRNAILILLAAILFWMAYPFIERMIDGRGELFEKRVPGHLELPSANDGNTPGAQ